VTTATRFQPSAEWMQFDTELPSLNESKGSGEPDDEIMDGFVQVVIEDISPPLENTYDPDKPRRAIKMRVLSHNGQTSSGEVGKIFRQYMTESTHVKSNMYHYFKAAAGGNMDPNVRPRLAELFGVQLRGTITHPAKDNDPNQTKQTLGSILPVPDAEYLDVPTMTQPPF
jgi:hypothetical protein